ncbi:hypothetical protein HPT25_22560 [Bacillus sp. BRMEA1]|uniref:hypothetical protein n=1 Tax=Neobacillus endophyticus TaxID=2738405 RepID=UPI0015674993|nr:hypothetical protein [Neobacillus endophyticus]NRD80125.1 hypothetical protein [Neobacillus endophyticus]
MTKIHEVTEALSRIDNELAQKWLHNDLIKKSLAESYDYWLEDTRIPIPLKDYIIQYLANAEFLGGIFS